MRDFLKKNPVLMIFFSILIAVVIVGCEPDPEPEDVIGTGDYEVCSTTSGLYNSGYREAELFYPCDMSDGPFAATTMSSGYTGTYDQMDWASEVIASHGFIVLAITPNNEYGYNSDWQEAHNGAIDELKSQNVTSSSPIYGMVRTSDLCIIGHSKGGGGTLLAADDQGSNIKAAIALAPYMDFSYNLDNIQAATQVQCGTEDTIADPDNAVDMFEEIPASNDRLLAYFDGADHLDWAQDGDSDYHARFLTYIVPWMKLYLDGDTSLESYLDGSQDWFYQYEYLKAGEEDDDDSCY